MEASWYEWMVRPRGVLCWLALAAGACSDASGDGGALVPTEDNLDGIYIERTGDSYTGLELRRTDLYGHANEFRKFEGTTAGDPVVSVTDQYYLVGHRLSVVRNNDFRSSTIYDITSFTGTRLTIGAHTYERVNGCPLAPRAGAWLWSQIYGDGTPAGTLAMALGPDGPAIAMGGRSDVGTSTLTYVRRLGCGFTATSLPLELGESQARLAYGPDGQPQIAAIRSGQNSISLARFVPTMLHPWVVIPVDLSNANDASAPIGMAIASDGTTWISHAILGDQNDFGLGVSRVAVDGTVTHSDILRSGGHHHSRLVLDAAGTPHVAYQNTRGSGVFIAKMSGASTWSIEGPISTRPPRELSGFAMSKAGAYHVGWVEEVGSEPGVRYSTNASGSWVTVPLSRGRGVDVALDSHDRAIVSYVHDPDVTPYIATNASGTWVETKAETAGVPGAAAPAGGGLAYYLSWTSLKIDANDKLYLAFDNLSYGTTSY